MTTYSLMLIFDVILNQFYVCIDIIHQINPFFRLTLITRLIDRIGMKCYTNVVTVVANKI